MNVYRAIFEGPNGALFERSTGRDRDTLLEALNDRPERSEETHAVIVGVEYRTVTLWRSVPLHKIISEGVEL